jgi:hypothetical protein
MVRILITLIGLHSVGLGGLMLVQPRWVIGLMGFTGEIPVFFPSQSGIFLVILGLSYLLALAEPAFIKIILLSKIGAVIFLVVHAALLGAPPIIWAAAAGDGAMLAVLSAALYREKWARSRAGAGNPPPSPATPSPRPPPA